MTNLELRLWIQTSDYGLGLFNTDFGLQAQACQLKLIALFKTLIVKSIDCTV